MKIENEGLSREDWALILDILTVQRSAMVDEDEEKAVLELSKVIRKIDRIIDDMDR